MCEDNHTGQGKFGWVWDPDVKLVRNGDNVNIETDLTVRLYAGRNQAEFAWVRSDTGEDLGIAKFCDWDERGHFPVYSPQLPMPSSLVAHEIGGGAKLIIPGDRDYEPAKALLEAAYELDD